MSLDAETIRGMDGPGLTRLAWEAGLAPDSVHAEGPYLVYGLHRTWTPPADLAQADAVFRCLRARGWRTSQAYFPDRLPAFGDIQAWKFPEGVTYSEGYPSRRTPTEAHALLLVSVLAVTLHKEEAPAS